MDLNLKSISSDNILKSSTNKLDDVNNEIELNSIKKKKIKEIKDCLRWPVQVGISAVLASTFLLFIQPSRSFFFLVGIMGPVCSVTTIEATAGGSLLRAWLIALCTCVGSVFAYGLFAFCSYFEKKVSYFAFVVMIFICVNILPIPFSYLRFMFPNATLGFNVGLSTAEVILFAPFILSSEHQPYLYALKRVLAAVVGVLTSVLVSQFVMVNGARPTALNSLVTIFMSFSDILLPLSKLVNANHNNGDHKCIESSPALILISNPHLLRTTKSYYSHHGLETKSTSEKKLSYDKYLKKDSLPDIKSNTESDRLQAKAFTHQFEDQSNSYISPKSYLSNLKTNLSLSELMNEPVVNYPTNQCQEMITKLRECENLLSEQSKLIDSARHEISLKKPHRFPVKKYMAIVEEIRILFFHIASLVFSINLYLNTPKLNIPGLPSKKKKMADTKKSHNNSLFRLNKSKLPLSSSKEVVFQCPDMLTSSLTSNSHKRNHSMLMPKLSIYQKILHKFLNKNPYSPITDDILEKPDPNHDKRIHLGQCNTDWLSDVVYHMSRCLVYMAESLRKKEKMSVLVKQQIKLIEKVIERLESVHSNQREKFSKIMLITLETDVTGCYDSRSLSQYDWIDAIGITPEQYADFTYEQKEIFWDGYWLKRDRVSSCSSTLLTLKESLTRCSELLDDYVELALNENDKVIKLLL